MYGKMKKSEVVEKRWIAAIILLFLLLIIGLALYVKLGVNVSEPRTRTQTHVQAYTQTGGPSGNSNFGNEQRNHSV